jgi:uncharacterized protein with NAD-binding domain and iron-sulfur cluster
MPKQKVAILGGGIGSLAAAFALTATPELRASHEVTVYQLGWRLGGKGASGRDPRPEYGHRIYEHGLHVWAGFYENAFRLMREAYAEWPRPAGAKLSVWYDENRPHESAFLPRSQVVFEEHVGDRWLHWLVRMPEAPRLPGDGEPLDLDDRWRFVRETLEATAEFIRHAMRTRLDQPSVLDRVLGSFSEAAPGHAKSLGRALAQSLELEQSPTTRRPHPRRVRRASVAPVSAPPSSTQPKSGVPRHASHADAFDDGDGMSWFLSTTLAILGRPQAAGDNRVPLLDVLDRFHHWFAERIDAIGIDDAVRRIWVIVDMALSTLRGVLRDDVIDGGLEPLDAEDWAAWLERHGASHTTLESPLVRGIYDYVFGYEDGDVGRPALGAGTAIHGIWRLLFTYKGAVFWEMQAAMGEVVFTPLYQVLARRGVRFEFFQRVKGLELGADKSAVERVHIGVQATLRNPAKGYQPLVEIGDLQCWPDRPLHDQLVEGERALDLESPASAPHDVGETVLQRGRDFDVVVLGIPVGALGPITVELALESARWRDMLAHVKVVQTQAMQLWLTSDKEQLGWTAPRGLLTAYAQPFNTWGDLSHLLDVERWPADTAKSAMYFCGPLPTMRADGDGFAAAVQASVTATAASWLGENAAHLWPGADDGLGGFDWARLVDPGGRSGAERLAAQYLRGNVSPSDAYVLSVPGSSRFRLEAGDSGFQNLFLAGDWVKTGIDAGCIEAAVMAGLAASRAICGEPRLIHGERPHAAALDSRRAPYAAYVERGGESCFRQPLELRGVDLSGYVVDADLDALETLCRRQLDEPAGGRARYVPLVPKVLLVAARIDQATSADEQDRDKGHLPEIDVGFWVPVGVLEPEANGEYRLVDLAWFLPYLWVDNPWAMVTGREIYGFPKSLGRFELPGGDGSGRLAVSTLALHPHRAVTSAREALVFELRRKDDGAHGIRRMWNEAKDAVGELFGGVVRPRDVWNLMRAEHVDAPDLFGHLFEHLGAGSVPMVFLKQFRDVADPSRACYRRVVTARAEVKPGSVRGAGLLRGDYVLHLAALDSHPVARDLGLRVGETHIDHAFRVEFDFTMQAGREV